MRVRRQIILAVVTVFAMASGSVAGLYVYVPNLLLVTSASEADDTLTSLEISQGVTPATDPTWAARPDLKRLDRTAAVMAKHWQKLEAKCDPNAVFALMYLQTTYGVRQHIREGYFADNEYLSIITVSFAKLYLDAYGNWLKGDRSKVQKGWLEAFDYAKSGQSSILEDEFLGMNAHINYDLSIAEASLGTQARDGTSRKPDMDRINHVLADVYDEVQYYEYMYYGPATPGAAPPPTPPPGHGYDPSVLIVEQPIYDWREAAWTNAGFIETLPTPELRAAHDGAMQDHAWTVAQGFHSPKAGPTAPDRVLYCQTHP
jgi:hypothetical protein